MPHGMNRPVFIGAGRYMGEDEPAGGLTLEQLEGLKQALGLSVHPTVQG